MNADRNTDNTYASPTAGEVGAGHRCCAYLSTRLAAAGCGGRGHTGCALLIPQGMAYAELAGLPAITGLYTTVVCLVAYAAFGPSPYLVLGPDSSLGPMIAAIILPMAAGNVEYAVALAGMLALMVGDYCHGSRRCQAGLCLRFAVETCTDRLYGRFGNHHILRPAAKTIRFFC